MRDTQGGVHTKGVQLTSYVRKSSSLRSSNSRRMTNAMVETVRSCFLDLNLTRTSAVPIDGCQVSLRPVCFER